MSQAKQTPKQLNLNQLSDGGGLTVGGNPTFEFICVYTERDMLFLILGLLACVSLSATEMKGFLTEEEISLFYQQGYVLKTQCLSLEEVQELHGDVTRVIDRVLKEIGSGDVSHRATEGGMRYIDGSRVVYKQRLDGSISIARINGCSGIEPKLLKTVRSEKMVWTFFELLGTDDLEHLISQIHPKLPGDAIAYPRHRDLEFRKSFDPGWQDILGNGSYAICIIPIDSMTPENGGLWVEKKGEEESRVWIYAQPGDLLFMHPDLYHGSDENLSAHMSRKTLLTGFCAFGANHKPYPGAHVNTRLSLTKEGEILIRTSPWSQEALEGLAQGH